MRMLVSPGLSPSFLHFAPIQRNSPIKPLLPPRSSAFLRASAFNFSRRAPTRQTWLNKPCFSVTSPQKSQKLEVGRSRGAA
jgi:hypothetical protein